MSIPPQQQLNGVGRGQGLNDPLQLPGVECVPGPLLGRLGRWERAGDVSLGAVIEDDRVQLFAPSNSWNEYVNGRVYREA
jgi:hypothetical protein